jgi:hypothetical protein
MHGVFMKQIISGFLLAVLASTLGCAGGSNGGSNVANNPVFQPQQPLINGNTMLYLYRPAATTPGVAKPLFRSYPEVFIDDVSVGKITYNSYMPIELKPGKHQIRLTGLTANAMGWETRDIRQTVTVKAGQASFLRLKVEYDLHDMNLLQPKSKYLIHLGPVSADDAQYEIRHTNRM